MSLYIKSVADKRQKFPTLQIPLNASYDAWKDRKHQADWGYWTKKGHEQTILFNMKTFPIQRNNECAGRLLDEIDLEYASRGVGGSIEYTFICKKS